MSSPVPMGINRTSADNMSDNAADSLDVSWLLRSNKDRAQKTKPTLPSNIDSSARPDAVPQAEPTPPQSPTDVPDTLRDNASAPPPSERTNGSQSQNDPNPINTKASPASVAPPPVEPPRQNPARPPLGRSPSNDDNKSSAPKGPINNLKNQGGRKGSWISNLSSKFSSSNSPTPRSASVDTPSPSIGSQGPKSPKVEFGNPFNKKDIKQDSKKDKKEEKIVITHIAPQPRRQSVLVSAGQETKLEHPGFLSSALRRLSSSNSVTLGKAAGSGAAGIRKTMNVDQNRDRVKITDFDQNNLRRVAFCVDVEIAGYAVQADEDDDAAAKSAHLPSGQRQSLASLERQTHIRKKDVKLKEKGEGAALKNPKAASEEKEELGETKVDLQAASDALKEAPKIEEPPLAEADAKNESQQVPSTRKKEKKKRSEAERKERRERKRRQAEANGLVPLELTAVNDDDSDSSPSNTPAGASTPVPRPGDQPTTDPLRIYKRCCQLRETTTLDRVKEQISKVSATLAEAPGTVPIVDLSGSQMALEDVVTIGDWLAVVPVRKLILDDCSLTDEALRVILSGLSGCKSAEQAKQNRKLPKRGSGKRGQEQLGVIEKLSLKNNPGISKLGWKHIALFLHMSRSLRAIDLSGIPFPTRSTDPSPGELSRTTTTSSSASANLINGQGATKASDIGSLFTRAICERFEGEKLEELIMSGCGLASSNVADLVDAAIKCKIRRLGLADNNLSPEALTHVVRYVKSGVCEGLDLGGNDLHESGHLVAEAVDENNPLFAISWSHCNLGPKDLELILTPLTKLKNFKFMDLSRNPALFSGPVNAVPVFRKFLPKLRALKRLHLCDVDMTPDHVIALSEAFPDCPGLAHISILENPPLVKAMNSTDNTAQEEACAFLASLMTAVRVSQSVIAVELEVPSADSSEVVKALASQIVAYSLRNMEHGALDEFGLPSAGIMPDKDAPEVLLHLVGTMEGYSENHDNDEPAPDEDYMIASTGIVKALGVCLGTKDTHSRSVSRNISPARSGTATPRQGALWPKPNKKPKDVSLELCESARKIRMRLRPALIKEDRAGNMMNYRRLLALDGTLERIIHRFEEEYPETKVPGLPASPPSRNGPTSLGSSQADASVLSASADSSDLSKILSADDDVDETPLEAGDPFSLKLSRTPSNTSLAAKALTHEEGRMLRFGQSMRRDLLKPTGMDDFEHGTSVNDPPEPEHLAALRAKLEQYPGEEIRRKVEADGADGVIRELDINAHELMALEKEDPEAFQAFRQSQLAAQINAGMISDPRSGEGKEC